MNTIIEGLYKIRVQLGRNFSLGAFSHGRLLMQLSRVGGGHVCFKKFMRTEEKKADEVIVASLCCYTL